MHKMKTSKPVQKGEINNWAFSNDVDLKTKIEKLAETDKSFDKFLTYVRSKKSICINLNLAALNSVLLQKKYLNVFEQGYSKDAIKERYNAGSIPYFDKFEAFAELIEDGKVLKYASLHTGGMGLNWPGFGSGRVNILLTNSFGELGDLFCLKQFSLIYLNSELDFDDLRFSEDVSSWGSVECLATIKHQFDLKPDPGIWDDLISNSSRGWLEILIFSDILAEDFERISIKKKLFEELERMDVKESVSDKYDQMLLLQWRSIKRSISNLNIEMTTL